MPEGLQLRTLLKLRSISWPEISGIDMSTVKDERAWWVRESISDCESAFEEWEAHSDAPGPRRQSPVVRCIDLFV
jgi:hypothetical protein